MTTERFHKCYVMGTCYVCLPGGLYFRMKQFGSRWVDFRDSLCCGVVLKSTHKKCIYNLTKRSSLAVRFRTIRRDVIFTSCIFAYTVSTSLSRVVE
jgi:hypothetical protein